jgi:hypothetical protein
MTARATFIQNAPYRPGGEPACTHSQRATRAIAMWSRKNAMFRWSLLIFRLFTFSSGVARLIELQPPTPEITPIAALDGQRMVCLPPKLNDTGARDAHCRRSLVAWIKCEGHGTHYKTLERLSNRQSSAFALSSGMTGGQESPDTALGASPGSTVERLRESGKSWEGLIEAVGNHSP